MSNSEYIEEVMHKAHARGFFHKMHAKVDELKKENPGIQNADAYYKAYEELKAEHEMYDEIPPLTAADHGDVDYVDSVDVRDFTGATNNLMGDDSWDY